MLLTRPPLSPKASFDLHVLSLPPAFALSQDQTLKLNEILIGFAFGHYFLTSPKHKQSLSRLDWLDIEA